MLPLFIGAEESLPSSYLTSGSILRRAGIFTVLPLARLPREYLSPRGFRCLEWPTVVVDAATIPRTLWFALTPVDCGSTEPP